LILAANKLRQPAFRNVSQVLNHAHTIILAVSLIQLFQTLAGEVAALKTESGASIVACRTIPYDAFLAMRMNIRQCPPATRTAPFGTLMAQAQGAIHPTSRNH
jgi:hypothetical protein